MPNTSTANVSIAGKIRFKALQRGIPEIKQDITYVNDVIIYFGSGMFLSSIGTIQVFTSISTTNVHVVDTSILFLLY